MDVKQVIEFADALCEDAKGDLTKMNRLGVNKALKFYLDNVVMLGTVTRETYATCYPQFMEEIEGIRLQAEKAEQAQAEYTDQGDRIAALEVKFDKLAKSLKRFLASAPTTDTEDEDDEEPEPEPAPKKRRSRKKPAGDDTDEEGQDAPAKPDAEETGTEE